MTFDEIAQSFVAARKGARALPGFPGDVPVRLADSYAIQDKAIALYDRPIIGWKIGRVAHDKQAEHNTERLCGPIFAPTLKAYAGEALSLPVYEGGFAAVEAEYVFRVDHDADPEKTEYTEEEALRLIDAVFAGIEMAGSPLATINALGPTVVATDFGNNFGLILSAQLGEFDSDTTEHALSAEAVAGFKATTEIDGQVVGEGGLFTMPGGPLKAIAWLAGFLAQRGRPLLKGQYISSGATTGIHDIKAGSTSIVRFTGPGSHSAEIRLNTVKLTETSAELT
jgi:2-keto-4-pentenoate hydratase